VNWIAGIVHAELPGVFRQRKAARLSWRGVWRMPQSASCWVVSGKSTTTGKAGPRGRRAAQSSRLSPASGYKDFDRPITLITPFSEEVARARFSPRRIAEIVPGRVYALSGSSSRNTISWCRGRWARAIGIDAGTRPDSAKARL